MSTILGFVALCLHMAITLAVSPLVVGAIRRFKARILGRAGPPLLQPYRDLFRLLRKQQVSAGNASAVFDHAPAIALASTIAAVALVPSFTLGMSTAGAADLLLIGGLLGIGRAALALAGMDIGTAFGGIGASREMTFAAFVEPVFLLAILTLALLVGSTNLDVVATIGREGTLGLRVSLGLILGAFLILAIVENGRIPVDNPATHLELTMVHEAMVLEYSGWQLALIDATAALKLTLWMSLIGAVFLPFGIAEAAASPIFWLLGIAAWLAKLAILGLALALLESSIAKMRVFRVPEFLGVALLLSVLAAIFLFVSQGFA